MTAPEPQEPRRKSHAQRLFELPPDATEVVLVRHGASQAYDGRPFELNHEGHGDPALSEEGHEQAELVGIRLAQESFAKLFVTSLQRTHQTAAPFAARSGLEPIQVPDLREIHLGEWEDGEYRARIAAADPIALRLFAEQRWDVIPGAESNEVFAERVRCGFDRVVSESGPGVSVVAVVHGAVIAELCRQATNSDPFAFVGADNTSVSRLVVFGDGLLRMRTFNDTTHLDPLRARRAHEPLV